MIACSSHFSNLLYYLLEALGVLSVAFMHLKVTNVLVHMDHFATYRVLCDLPAGGKQRYTHSTTKNHSHCSRSVCLVAGTVGN